MDKAQFLRNLRASPVKLHAVNIEGWDDVIYMRAQTLGDIREVLMNSRDEKDVKSSVREDPLYLARSIADIVRDETGALIFNSRDDEQMRELMAAMENSAPAISKRINEAYNALNDPAKSAEVTAGGN